MSSSTIANLFTGFADELGATFGSILSIIVPVAIVLAILFGAIAWIVGSARRKAGR